MDRRDFLSSTGAAAAALSLSQAALAQGRPKDVLVVANEFGPNSLDIHTVGANRPSYGVSWLVYDRLMTYGRKTLPDGRVMYDLNKLEPELAESWKVDAEGVTFKLRKNAKFHDGTPVTAKDVKWSFDRAVTVGGFPTFQMAAGSLQKPEQFVVIDEHTFRVKFLRADKLTMNDLAVVVPCVFNSELVKKNATPQDPWGLAWTRNNTAGGGAFKVEAFRPGQEIVYVRNDEWKSGPLPKLRRVIQREVPNAGNRRALLLKGDIDITYDLPPKDFSELSKEAGNVKVATMPIENSMYYLGMNTTKPPFNNPKVRQAVAYAVPYERL
ncbi:MAG: ABC transporter substrate-binding protein, partial [Rubrivivax sp.]|nr:ABC transporter substrate-binding protein [Rubrivivax sp.]